ncbi:MAG: FtsX-like permease family protein, partial [Pseudomonadota bacterium]|nr:FtsX-like permease family protein [Pseudomonadota bacterium]
LARSELLLFTAGIATLTALAAGSYPAFWLSGFKPAQVLRGSDGVPAGAVLRNTLVVLQFTLAIALVAATLVIYLQMNFVRDMDLGFTRNDVAVLRGTKEKGLGRQWPLLKRELLNHPNVVAVTEGTLFPGATGQRKVRVEGGVTGGIDMANVMGGYEFLQTYDIPLVAGRYFDEQLADDTLTLPGLTTASELRGSYVLSESAVRALGLNPEEALGRRLEMDFSRDFSIAVPGPVIGVVEDIHPYSLHEVPRPMVFFVPESSPSSFTSTLVSPLPGQLAIFDQASVVLSDGDAAATLAWIRERWRMFTPDVPLMHEFLDARYAALYRQEEQQARLFTFFAALTTVVACLGLFGLSAFIVEKRFREIGMRKVMGSSVRQIIRLLTCDFSKLVLLANLIAWPVTYLAMERWLQTFAYRIDLTPLIFIGSGLIALCIAWVTVGGTAAKAATQKPVLALRYE